mgnify:CR=1 FL=1
MRSTESLFAPDSDYCICTPRAQARELSLKNSCRFEKNLHKETGPTPSEYRARVLEA